MVDDVEIFPCLWILSMNRTPEGNNK